MPRHGLAGSFEPTDVARLQRRTVWVLSSGQVLGGIALGASLSLGALLAADVSGDDALSGLATASLTLGAAAFAVPMAAVARRGGRRLALSAGMLIALVGVGLLIAAATMRSFPVLLVAFVLIGSGTAANLQSRFAATDLAGDTTRGRDLSIVVWATTVGVVVGPNLTGPGEAMGAVLGMPHLTGPYLFTIAGQALAIVLYLVALRPDPLIVAAHLAGRAGVTAGVERADRPRAARFAIIAIAGSHGVMVAVMAMTPVQLEHHGATLAVVGFTISLHVAGMYALSPVFGVLADRWGRVPTILLGQGLLVASLLTAAVAGDSHVVVTVSLVLLGLGWSAATVAGSALLTESSAASLRTRRQGRSDLTMNLVGASGAALAGIVLGWIGYAGLALLALVVVAIVVMLSPLARRSQQVAAN